MRATSEFLAIIVLCMPLGSEISERRMKRPRDKFGRCASALFKLHVRDVVHVHKLSEIVIDPDETLTFRRCTATSYKGKDDTPFCFNWHLVRLAGDVQHRQLDSMARQFVVVYR